MNIFINGQRLALTEKSSLERALETFLSSKQRQQSFALALNGRFIGKALYVSTLVNEGDSVDILLPIQGG